MGISRAIPDNDKELLEDILTRYKVLYKNDTQKLRNAIPADEIWRFVIDGNRQQEGWLKFEKTEPGYLEAMTNSLQKIYEPSADMLSLQNYIR